MSVESRSIALLDLNISKENPRFEAVASQKEAIDKMIEDQGDKLVILAKHILEHGLNPNERIQVIPSLQEKTKYDVVEGNRRVIVLKLLSNPEMIDIPTEMRLKNKFKDLHNAGRVNLINEVDCIVYDSFDEAQKWIELKHTGENNGAGVVTWTSDQKARFSELRGKKSSFALQIKNTLQNSPEVPATIKTKLNEIKSTNIERLIDDPYVRKFLGIETNNGIIYSVVPQKEVIKGLTQIAEDLLSKDFNVRDIYYKEDRKKYIDDFKAESKPNTAVKAEKPWQMSTSTQPMSMTKKAHAIPTTRRVLIPRKCALRIDNPKINRIYHEFQSLDVNKYTNACAVMFRVFVELSCDCYLEHHKLVSGPSTAREGKSLEQKVSIVADHLDKNKLSAPDICKGIKKAVREKHGILGIDTFNAYLHNHRFSPKAEDLITAWDNIEDFVKIMWDNIK